MAQRARLRILEITEHSEQPMSLEHLATITTIDNKTVGVPCLFRTLWPCLCNKLGNSMLFCIGNTTAAEAKKHSENIILANKPTVENVLVQAINYYKNL